MLADLNQNLSIDPADLPSDEVIFGSTAAMLEVRCRLDHAVREGLPVLIQGESGTGKEVIAKYLHLRSSSCAAPFIKVNCIALTPSLLLARLEQRDTKLSAAAQHVAEQTDAESGTLFLDEIGDMEWTLQKDLIGLLSSQDAAHSRDVVARRRVRIVCSTRIAAEPITAAAASEDGTLVHLSLPPLRERTQDIPALCDFLVRRQAGRFGKTAHGLTPRTLRLLEHWQWPGNLRELENWVARVVILGSQEKLAEELRHQAVLDGAPADLNSLADGPAIEAPAAAVSAATQATLLRVLEAHGWSRRRAARELRMSYRALLGRLRDANVPRRRRSHRGIPPMG
ncbi:MAG: sigma 54-interacting transcriptional regulator [Terracidiphilus sp.]